jgi:hypothetical protein
VSDNHLKPIASAIAPGLSTALVLRPEAPLPAPLPEAARTLAEIARDVQRSHAEFMAGLSQTAVKAIETGEFLLEAKQLVKHGQWQDFVMLDCGLKLSTAQMYMKLAAHKDELEQLVAANPQSSRGLSQAQALKFLSSAQQKRKLRKAPNKQSKFWRR